MRHGALRGALSSSTFEVRNPLPLALHHYEDALLQDLRLPAIDVLSRPLPPIERAARVGSRLTVLAQHVAERGRRSDRIPIVIWPVFGLWEPASWRLHDGAIVVVHEPQPLTRKDLGPIRAFGASRFCPPSIRVVTHGRAALQKLVELGFDNAVALPHPIRMQAPSAPRREGVVRVLGRYKAARNLDPLPSLARAAKGLGLHAQLSGPGWPQLEGWTSRDGFLTEADMEADLGTADVVVIPYRYFWASGIAVRALEHLTPVVGPRHPFLEELLGADWVGLVDEGDWSGALERATQVTQPEMVEIRERARRRATSHWRDFLSS